ncbi:amino acid ABC transporter permease [Nostocoides australiense]|nr:amino acid ABC transporter permease [Actinomycetota bacterium]MCB1254697.1 amino acid ABC transporter permease [Austwickia sp.]HPF81061.1 amino acid ABC transporter permease [Tetrasphaera australiensis]HRW02673.1 amino acid ABC transporter permease [Tetrasphaera sp.]
MSTSVLFDAPGPKARRRHRVVAITGGLLLLVLLALVGRALHANGEFAGAKWSPFADWGTWRYYLLLGIWNTIKAAAAAVVLAMIFGFVFGVGRLSRNVVIRWVSGAIVEFFRAVPVLIMMIFFFGVFAYNQVFPAAWNPFAAVVTALTLYNGSVIAELVRSGVFGLPKGQAEAGLSIGLTPGQTLRNIQLPQAITAMLPALVSQLVVILKDTALGTIITYPELLQQAQNLASARSNVIPALLVAAAVFIAINYLLTWLAARLEARINRRGHTAGAAIGRAPTVPGAPVDQAHAAALTPHEARHDAAHAGQQDRV